MFRYTLTLVIFLLLLVAFVWLAWRICCMIDWGAKGDGIYAVIYALLYTVREYIILFFGLAFLCGWAVITYIYFSRPLCELDEVVAAAEQLAVKPEETVHLSAGMRETQNELNLVRERALGAQKAAREAEQRKNDLIVYLAHDLKTPLTSVIGYLSLLTDEKDISPENRDKYTRIALDKAQRLEDLVNEFFDITRFNLSHIELKMQRINLTRMLEQLMFEFEPVLAEKRLRFDARLSSDIELLCDPDKFERVFDNLFRNAANYSYPDTEIAVTLSRVGARVVIRVENHGATIPPTQLERIFEQFYRADRSRTSATGGAGLGLAIARELTELHGGTISATSADEKIGFLVSFPASVEKN